MDTIDNIKQWLEGQLETATEDGGNEILPGTFVEGIDPAYTENSVAIDLSDDSRVIFTITTKEL